MTRQRISRAEAPGGGGQTEPDAIILDTFRLVAQTRLETQQVAQRARDAIAARYRDPQALANFIESHGTPVYVLTGGFRAVLTLLSLQLLGYEPGFIPPSLPDDAHDARAVRRYRILRRVLSRVLGLRPGADFAHGVFVLPRALFTVGYASHQLHHWLSFLAGLPGYEAQDQETFRAFMNEHRGVVSEKVLQMSPARLAGLRRAIHREIEALQFLKTLTDELFRPSNQAQRILKGALGA